MRHTRKGFSAIGIGIGVTAFAGLVCWLSTAYLDHRYARSHQGCQPRQPDHAVTIKNNVVTPGNTVAHRCETLTITNKDDVQRILAFGVHDHHVIYDGIEEKTLSHGQSVRVTLLQAGNFRFHDHLNDAVKGTFTVK